MQWKKRKAKSVQKTKNHENALTFSQTIDEQTKAPWLKASSMNQENIDYAFHLEILDFFDYIKPPQSEIRQKQLAFSFLKNFFETNIPDCSLFCFGSSAMELCLPGGDIDLVLFQNDYSTRSLFNKTSKLILKNQKLFGNVEQIIGARVPIIKFVVLEFGYDCDLCFNEKGGLETLAFMQNSLQKYPPIGPIFIILKLFLRQRRLHLTFKGGIGSYLLFCLVLHFIKFYNLKISTLFGKEMIKCINMAQYILQFLHYFGSEFNYREYEIVLSENPPFLKKKQYLEDSLQVLNILENCHDIGAGSFNCQEIFGIFHNRYVKITKEEHQKGKSILAHLINPAGLNFSIYEKY